MLHREDAAPACSPQSASISGDGGASEPTRAPEATLGSEDATLRRFDGPATG